MATKKKAAKPKKAAPKKKAGVYSPKLMQKWNPGKDSNDAKIERLMKKGYTRAEIIVEGFASGTVGAALSNYRRIHGLANSGKVFNKKGELVLKSGVKAAVATAPAKKETKPVPVAKPVKKKAKPAVAKSKPAAPKKKAAVKKAMGISDNIPDDAVEIDPLFADVDPVDEDDDQTASPIM